MISTHKHGKTSRGSQRYFCLACQQTFTDTFDTLYYRRRRNSEQVHTVLQSHVEGSSLRGISRISQLAYGTVVSIVARSKPQGSTDSQCSGAVGKNNSSNC